MSQKTRTDLKAYFNTGDRPTEGEFADFIDSVVNIKNDKPSDLEIDAGTTDDKFVTVLSAKKVARKSIKVNNVSPDLATGNIVLPATELPLTFGTGLTRTTNNVAVNTTQNITTLSNLTTAGVVKTTAGGVLSSSAVELSTSDVLGVLPIANGGTGSSSQNFVDLTTAQSIGNKTLKQPILSAGIATAAPLSFTPAGSVLLTIPVSGKIEVDTAGLLYGSNASGRGSIAETQYLIQNSAFQMINVTPTLQKCFNSSTLGAFTVQAATTYEFEAYIDLSGLNTASSTFGFGFLGTGAIYTLKYFFSGIKGVAILFGTSAVPTITVVSGSSIVPTGSLQVKGIIRVTTGGIIIPAIGQSASTAAPITGINSYFKIKPIGNGTVTTIGNFS
jgi:hypothetical protein